MTSLAEPPEASASPGRELDGRWRTGVLSAQRAAMPEGRTVVSCPAPFGDGGLGRHLAELVHALERGDVPHSYISEGPSAAAVPGARGSWRALALSLGLRPAARFSPAYSMLRACAVFDAQAAGVLPGAEHLLAFNGSALRQLEVARAAGFRSLRLISATAHLRRVKSQYELAHRKYPLERSWAARMLPRSLAEYSQANVIYASTRHIRESFLEEGFAEESIRLFPLTPDPRFAPSEHEAAPDTFEVLYVGSLSVAKGVPLLVDAVRRLRYPDLRLKLLGGWGSRGMRRFIEGACAGDERISVARGDPLPHMHAARLYVHPSYEDGFAYAPVEALACGVPVAVSEHTGMKELVDPGRNGVILPTGDLDALTAAIEAAYGGRIVSGRGAERRS